ncbi:MAG: thioredoxin family protein [Rhodothermales bacterium]
MAVILLVILQSIALPPKTLEWATLPEAIASAQAAQQPTIVYVEAAWCSPCRQLERETFADARVHERLAHFSTAKLTFDDHDTKHRIGPYRLSEAGWAKRFGAARTPTLIILDAAGAVLAQKTGFLSAEHLMPILDAALVATSNGR